MRLAILAENDPDFRAVAEAWPALPKHIRDAIQTLAATTGKAP